ncbi:MAG: aminodeoxychorismate/anthranilate synthase component II [Bacillota bacterium]|nr:aminodeoxychorismate/anthranilate synthase component II [Bacillota bacterium]MDP4159504.1 aminodeoxychorismate/anthranilate synthase component II [Bacillota bacterium]
MILLIDNYDSFSYNLVQLAGSINSDIMVVRNDELTVEEIAELNPSHIILSPGPGYPKNAGVCEEVIRKLSSKSSILGVCLGHQGICEAYGVEISHARKLMHGKKSKIQIDNTFPIFHGLPQRIDAARYHSLVAQKETMTNELLIIAEDDSREIMAVKHKDYDVYGVQFHPESILTPMGHVIMKNFLEL